MINPSLYGLTADEFQHITRRLGREPNPVEMGIFSAMWSEHCSYKHTRSLMKNFPTSAAWVVQGPGENAGVVSIDADWAVVFKIESHNHPSYVAPYDGASTGVGGLLRDVMAMGARPVGVKALLRCGPLDNVRTRSMMAEIRKGAEDYAAGCKVASLGVELATHPSYASNPLVNVIVLGLARKDALMTGSAGKAGNLLWYFGKATGADGVNGAAFASKGMDEGTEAHPPAGDPQAGYELMQATLELIESGLLAGLQDMGAAGLTCSCFEMAARAGKGLELDLGAVPLVSPGVSPYEMLLSETQERMLAALPEENVAGAQRILARYPHLVNAAIGRVTDGDEAVLRFGEECVARLPVSFVADGFLRFALSGEAPTAVKEIGDLTVEVDENASAGVAGQGLKASQLEGAPGAQLPGRCSRLDFPAIGKSVFLRTLANGPEILRDAHTGAKNLVLEAVEELKAEGARPLALSDGLNFGNPADPEVATQITQSVLGIAQGCRETGVPVVGGNVSLYNETNGHPILGQAFIGVVGVADYQE